MKKLVIFMMGLIIIITACKAKEKENKTDMNIQKKHIIGYIFSRDNKIEPQNIEIEKLTHINYAFSNIENGVMIEGFQNDSVNFEILNKMKMERNPQCKILVSVGGWTWSGNFSDMALTAESRNQFIQSAVTFLRKHHLDGLDVDWEYPGLPGYGNTHRPEDKENFTYFLKETREALNKAGDEDDKHYLLTIAAAAFQDFIDHTEMNKAHLYLDFLNIMSYDFYGEWDSITGHHTNLYTKSGDPRGYSVDKAVKLFLNENIPSEKIVVGMAFYGRGWKINEKPEHLLFQKAEGVNLGFSHQRLVENFIDKNGYIRKWDEEAQAPYLWNDSLNIMITYDDTLSVEKKCQYINDNQLGGAMFWVYGSDYKNQLLNKINTSLH